MAEFLKLLDELLELPSGTLKGGEELADRMYISGALAMWLPNIIIGCSGIILIIIVNNRTTVEGLGFIKDIFPRSKK